jgi:hypothetical protein
MTDRPSRVKLSPAPAEADDTDPGFKLPRRFQVPWGLVAALGLYVVGVGLYVTLSTRSSPEYQAAKHYLAAQELLGPSGGRNATRAELERAYDELLEAARLQPQVLTFHRKLEGLNGRFAERHWEMPPGYRLRAEAVAGLYRRIQDAQEPLLVVGAHDKGWDPEQLLARPTQVAKWSVLGALGIVVLWFALRLGEKQRQAMARHANLERIEEEIAEIGRQRRR